MLTYDPFATDLTSSVRRDMRRLQREVSDLISRTDTPGRSAVYPAFNLWSNSEGAVITAELPGVVLDDLDISVVGDTLTVKGSRRSEPRQEGETYHRRERGLGSFARVVQLPFRVETEDVWATLKNGVLQITLPMAEADRPRKIQVKSA